jgi:transcription-repair coupling factor (superfamily II helicase)
MSSSHGHAPDRPAPDRPALDRPALDRRTSNRKSPDAVDQPPVPVDPGDVRRWTGLHGCARGLCVASAAADHQGPTVVVVPDTPSAHRLETELRFFSPPGEGVRLLHFPDWETLPYDVFSPHEDITSERLATLKALPDLQRGVLVVPVTTLMSRLPPRAYLEGHAVTLRVGDQLDIEPYRQRLEAAGYRCVGQVMEHGEFAVRGSLLDLFPMGTEQPLRIDLLDDEVDTIRPFDPETQRSSGTVDSVELLPAREIPLDADGIARFRRAWRAQFEGEPSRCPVYRDVSQGLSPAGIEYYLPLFFDAPATLLDHLPADALIILYGHVHEAGERFWEEVGERYEQGRHDRERPLLPPDRLFVQTNELFRALGACPQVRLEHDETLTGERAGLHRFDTRAPTSLPVDARAERPLALLEQFLAGFAGRVLIVAETPGRRETLLETFRAHGIHPVATPGWQAFLEGDEPLAMTVAPLERGAVLGDLHVAVVTETQLFGERVSQRRRRARATRDAEAMVRNLTELHVGAPVVHEHHGIGRYRGLETLTAGGLTSEFLTIEYADGDRLYVPVVSLHLVSRYTGAEPDNAPLHKLGSQQWQKARRKAAQRAFDVAAELLDIQARRLARAGNRFEIDAHHLRLFEQGFPFEETPDQEAAIAAVLEDMRSSRPMDRLVCGDVGFGKTEVAMRAAFVAVQAGWQVAILVPTTLLTQQHHQTFSDRFADWPVRVEQLSRFRSRKERDAVLADLASGKVDIVVGTHKLIQDDVRFKRLGLVVLDEEHRFGVRQKERLKSLRSETDVLTLTATPIPRTLNMALGGMRDLSLIATPPERRLSIKTFVRQWDKGLIREACLREIHRGGQVYFVHNRVEDIEEMAVKVEALMPDAQVRVAHGQMRERDLERTMQDFYHRRFNILVCTTIIETGIDVPSANTIVINRADRFGLAQLHQLRGRVGRSHHRAYAYLLAPPPRSMTADAAKRLEAIESLEDLGIGFSLATHDLEIRGAGELLGEEQSGQIHEVGYSLYTEMLERAVRALKAGRAPQLDRPLDHGAEVDLRAPALIPDDYLPDVHARLIMYKRIASARTKEELRELQVDMIDRFGLLPDAVKLLFRITALKLRATPLGIRKADLGERGGRIVFERDAAVDPQSVVGLLQSEPKTYRLDGPDKLRLTKELPEVVDRAAALEALLDRLGTRQAA